MGQTLTHGIYLPDEGERNCYAGLAANWQLLDGAVGTVAEHTTALAGKAPLVHTHAKSDITDFPVYGTTAGTICEGNDSRLSDARTPVAHTHGKSEITDLLNSNFIPSANNSYDLGSSSYQWNNLYAKNYYYNGTAWGLDKANVWSNYNYFSPYRFQICSASQEIGVLPSSNQWNGFVFADKNNNSTVSFEHAFLPAETRFKIQLVDNIKSNESGTTVYDEMMRMTLYSGGKAVVFDGNLRSFANGVYNLGDSNQKWKTLNGVNPGALSLPKGGNTENTDWFDISSHITNVSGNSGANSYEAPSDGWIVILGKDEATSSIFIWNRASSGICASAYGNGTQGAGRLAAILPVRKGMNMGIICKFSSASDIYLARFYPCEGNV